MNNEIDSSDSVVEIDSSEMGQSAAPDYVNFMGAPSYKLGAALTTLEIMGASCFFGEPKYYEYEKTASVINGGSSGHYPQAVQVLGNSLLRPNHSMEDAIDAALNEDPEGTLQLAVRLRQLDHMRKTPQVILVRAAKHPKVSGTPLIGRYAPFITARGDEVGVQKAYHDKVYGKKRYPNALKRFWASRLEKMSRYQLAKYKNIGKLVDVANVAHPKATPQLSEMMKGTLALTEGDTWEALISSKGSTRENWIDAIPLMGHMALLRNLNNFKKFEVPEELYLPKLVDTAEKGKQLPFRYYSAYKTLSVASEVSCNVEQALNDAMKASLSLVPQFNGRVLSLCDNSGSAQDTRSSPMSGVTVATVANLSALITSLASDDGHVGVFGDRLEMYKPSKSASIFKELDKICNLGQTVGGSTENGVWLALDTAIQNKEMWDHIFIYSDMQAGHGGLYGKSPKQYKDYCLGDRYIDVPSLINAYRKRVNSKVNVFLVQVAGYGDTMIPETFPRTYVLGGWGGGILKYAERMKIISDNLNL